MVRGIREREKIARQSQRMAAVVAGSVIVLATGMEVQTQGAATATGSTAQFLAAGAGPALVASSRATAQRLVDRMSRGAWDTFTARIEVRRQTVTADGAPIGPAVATTAYTWERARTMSGWKTTMTLVGATPVRVRARTGMVTLPDAPTVVKTEDPGDGSAPRFWDRNGAEIRFPSASMRAQVLGPEPSASGAALAALADDGWGAAQGARALPAGAGTDWIDTILMSGEKRAQRLGAFERQFGLRRGVIRGLSRHVRQQGDGEREVLVDEGAGVPIEANLVANGELVSHSTFAYERAASGALLRRGVRTERLVSGGGGMRMVTEVSFNDITVEQKGGR
jgi:hypothetical protein